MTKATEAELHAIENIAAHAAIDLYMLTIIEEVDRLGLDGAEVMEQLMGSSHLHETIVQDVAAGPNFGLLQTLFDFTKEPSRIEGALLRGREQGNL